MLKLDTGFHTSRKVIWGCGVPSKHKYTHTHMYTHKAGNSEFMESKPLTVLSHGERMHGIIRFGILLFSFCYFEHYRFVLLKDYSLRLWREWNLSKARSLSG
jgi:hypothetical protein